MKTVVTESGRAQQILAYVKDEGIRLIGVGGVSAWQLEGNPPQPDPLMLRINDAVGFFPVSKVYAAVSHPQGEIGLANGDKYLRVDIESIEDVVLAGVRSVIVEGIIPQQELVDRGVTAYRTLGLCLKSEIGVVIQNSRQYIGPNDVRRYGLDLVTNQPPIICVPQTEHLVRFIRRF